MTRSKVKPKPHRFKSTAHTFQQWYLAILVFLIITLFSIAKTIESALMNVIMIIIPIAVLAFVIKTYYTIENGFIKKYTIGTNQGGLAATIKISELEMIELLHKNGEVIGMKLYNSDRILPRATLHIKQASTFLNQLKIENPNIKIR